MTTTRPHALPWTFRQFVADLFPTRRPVTAASPVLTGREATARHLFGEAVHWSRLDMLEYDNDARLRGGWLAEADRRIAHAGSPDRHVAAHWGYTAAEWLALPAIVQVDKREGFYQARGLGS